jgi:glycosyltransferase involved in cell wall biosynthesis
MSRTALSIVIPIFNEQEVLDELRRRLTATLDQLDDVDWKVLYVDDGSNRPTREALRRHHGEDTRFTVLELSRNFGHQAAITAGLAHASADAVIIMDGDLQDPPEVIPDMLAAWRDGGQVVFAVRRSRAEWGLRGMAIRMFHALFRLVSDYPIPPHTGVFALLDRSALAAMNLLQERNRFLPGLNTWIGFRRRQVEYDRQARAGGEPKQSMGRLFRYALNAVFSFSYKPLRLMTGTGLVISLAGFSLGLVFVFKRLAGIETAQTGFTTLVTLVLFLGGLQLIAIGLVGEYLGRVYDEVKRRPVYLVRSRLGVAAPAGEARNESTA